MHFFVLQTLVVSSWRRAILGENSTFTINDSILCLINRHRCLFLTVIFIFFWITTKELEMELLDKVVKCLSEIVKKPEFPVAEYPTGLNFKLQDFEETVLLQQQQTRMIWQICVWPTRPYTVQPHDHLGLLALPIVGSLFRLSAWRDWSSLLHILSLDDASNPSA